MTPERAAYLRRTDPLADYADYVDGDGVQHAWDHAGDHRFDAVPDWYHPDPRRPTCRDRTCPGNRFAQRAEPLVRVVGGGTTRDHEEFHYHVAEDVDRLAVHARLVEFVRDLDWELRHAAGDGGWQTATETNDRLET